MILSEDVIHYQNRHDGVRSVEMINESFLTLKSTLLHRVREGLSRR